MNGNDVNLLEMSYDDINSMRKQDLVEQIEKTKGKIIFDSHVKDLCNQIEKLTESLNQVTIVYTPPLFFFAGGVEPPIKFSDSGGLTGPQLWEGVAGKEG